MARATEDRPAVRRHHRRRHGAAVVHAAAAARQAGRGRRAAAGHARWAWTPRWSSTPRRWGRTSRSSSCTARSTTWSTRPRSQVVEREYPLLTAKEVDVGDQARPAPPAGRRRRLHRHRRAHRRHRRDPQHQGVRGGEGAGVLPRDQGRQPRRPGARARAGRAGPRAVKADAVLVSQVVTQRDAHLHNTREMSAAFNEAYPAGRRPLLVVGGPRFDETLHRRARGGPDLRQGHHARRGGQLPRPRPRPAGSLRSAMTTDRTAGDPRPG